MTGVYLPDEAATRALGATLGAAAQEGDVIAALGTLGAGKTCLAQGVAVGLEVDPGQYVNSPTFAILQSHPGRIALHHIDLYRIGDPEEALGLGLEEYVGVTGLAYVEWPSRLPELLPPDTLWLRLHPEGDGRRLEWRSYGPRSERLAQAIIAAHAAPDR